MSTMNELVDTFAGIPRYHPCCDPSKVSKVDPLAAMQRIMRGAWPSGPPSEVRTCQCMQMFSSFSSQHPLWRQENVMRRSCPLALHRSISASLQVRCMIQASKLPYPLLSSWNVPEALATPH